MVPVLQGINITIPMHSGNILFIWKKIVFDINFVRSWCPTTVKISSYMGQF